MHSGHWSTSDFSCSTWFCSTSSAMQAFVAHGSDTSLKLASKSFCWNRWGSSRVYYFYVTALQMHFCNMGYWIKFQSSSKQHHSKVNMIVVKAENYSEFDRSQHKTAKKIMRHLNLQGSQHVWVSLSYRKMNKSQLWSSKDWHSRQEKFKSSALLLFK